MKINYQMELTRRDVTPAQFLAYIRSQAKKHDIPFGMELDYFTKGDGSNSHYIGGTPETRPCESETCKALPCDHQTYMRAFNGSVYNEIIEFTYDTETTGHGYYYTISADGEPDDAERIRTSTINYHTRKIEQNTRKIEKNTIEINETQDGIDKGYRDEKVARYYIDNLKHENDRMTRENDEHAAAIAEMTGDQDSAATAETSAPMAADERAEMTAAINAAGIKVHDCNASTTPPTDNSRVYWFPDAELRNLYDYAMSADTVTFAPADLPAEDCVFGTVETTDTTTDTETTTEKKEDKTMITTTTNNTTTAAEQTFPRLLAEIDANYDRLTADTFHYIRRGWFPSWANEHHNDPDRGIKQYSTARRWEQYKTGEITREKAIELAERRAVNEIEKNRAKKIARLETAANALRISSASVTVEWAKSRTWGANPTAELLNLGDGRTVGHASGCGYDKESAAIAEAMNASPAALRVLYELGEAALKRGESPRSTSACSGYHWGTCIGYGAGYDVLPYWEGGVGASCFWKILEKAGYTVRHAGSGKRFDCYTFYIA